MATLSPMADSHLLCSQATLDTGTSSNTSVLMHSLSCRNDMPPLSDCSSSSSSSSDEDSTFTASASHVPIARTALDLDSSEPLSFRNLWSEIEATGPAAHGASRFPCVSPFATQPGLRHLNALEHRQLGLLSAADIRDAPSSFLQAEAAEGNGQADLSDSQFTQPLLWMSHKCHWMRDNAGVVAPPGRQQLELAGYLTSPTSVASLDSALKSVAPHSTAAAQLSGLTTDGMTSESLPLDISRLLSQYPGVQRCYDRACSDSCEVVDLQRELQHTGTVCTMLVSALVRKTRECENLRAVVRDLTTIRARGAGAKLALQERCSHLVSDVARLQHVADAARRGQLASVKAMHSANAAKIEAECRAACLQQQQSAALEARGAMTSIGSSSPCSSSMRRIASGASLHIVGDGHHTDKVPRLGASC